MPAIPNLLERLFLRLNLFPPITLDWFAALGMRAVASAVRLSLFEALAEGPLTAAQAARQLGLSERGTLSLLEVLVVLGYVHRRGDRYANAPAARKWLLHSSAVSLVGASAWFDADLVQIWEGLDQAVREGGPGEPFYRWLEARPEVSRAFQAWAEAAARLIGGPIVSAVKLPTTVRRLLDVGGGHGLYSVMFCRRHLNLRATVFDFAGALESARGLLEREGMADRISLVAGDFLADDLGTGFDVALVFNVVHGLSPEENTRLFERVARALNPGGILVVSEQFSGRMPGPMTSATMRLLDLHYFLALGGAVYRAGEVSDWLAAAGFPKPRRVSLRTLPGLGLLIGTRPGDASATS